MELTKRFVSNVRTALTVRDMSQNQLAKHLGMHRQQVSQMLGTEKYPPVDPTLKTIDRVCKVLKINPSDILLPTRQFKKSMTAQ